MKRFNKTQRDLFWFMLPGLFSRGSQFLVIPVYTRVLSPAQFGEVAIALTVANLVQLFVLPGTESLYLRFGFGGKAELGLDAFSPDFKRIALFHLFLGIVLFPLLTLLILHFSPFFFPGISKTNILIALIGVVTQSFQAPLLARLQIQQKAKKVAAIINFKTILGMLTALSGLFLFKIGGLSLLLGELVSGVFLLPFSMPIFFKGLKTEGEGLPLNEVMKLFSVNGIGNIISWSFNALDRFLLNRSAGTAVAGTFTAGYQIGSIIVVLQSLMGKQFKILINLSRIESIPTRKDLRTLYQLSLYCFLYAAAFLSSLTLPLVTYFLGAKFQSAQRIIPIACFACVFRQAEFFLNTNLWADRQKKKVISSYLFAFFIFVIACFLFIPRFGAEGAAWAGVLGLSMFAVYPYFLGDKDLYFPLPVTNAWSWPPLIVLGVCIFKGLSLELSFVAAAILGLFGFLKFKEYVGYLGKITNQANV